MFFEDNQKAIKLASTPVSSNRTRDIDVKHHYIRDAVLEKNVYIVYIRTEYQHADMLTKPLNTKLIGKYVGALMNAGRRFDWRNIVGQTRRLHYLIFCRNGGVMFIHLI